MKELTGKDQLYKKSTELAGTFEVAKQLCLRNYIVSLTQNNFPDIDLFVHSGINGKSIPIQVKSLRYPNSGGFNIKKKCLKLENLFVIFIVIIPNKNDPEKLSEFYIASASEVKKKVKGKLQGISLNHIKKFNWKDCWNIIEEKLK